MTKTPSPKIDMIKPDVSKIDAARTDVARVLIVDDHPVVRQGIVRMIEQEPDMTVCGEAETPEDAMAAIAAEHPTIVLADLSLGNSPGLEMIRQIRASNPELPVLVLSMHDESIWAERVLRAGACGFVMKQEKPRVLIQRLRQALAGNICLSEAMSERLLRKFTGHKQAPTDSEVEALGDREMEVLQLLASAMSSRDIAATMHVSVKTVEAHRENIKRKLGLTSAAELLRFAVLRFTDK
jgi:DNA-binding NarL/FixJ family response regulator